MKRVYFRHTLEKTSFINFRDKPSPRSEFLNCDKRTDVMDLVANLDKLQNAFKNYCHEIMNFNTI